MKEIARIEAEVLRAKARREGTPESALPPVTPPPAEPAFVPPAAIPAIPNPTAPAAAIPSIPSPSSMPTWRPRQSANGPYRKALPLERARRELTEGIGTQFCPTAARALLDVIPG